MAGFQLDLSPTLTLNTSYSSPKMFVIVGAGGTGGYFIPNLARQISITNKLRKMEHLAPHKMLIIDADSISLSNLNRQNFIEKDLDRNKAEVLAGRYGLAFSTNIQYLEQYITSTEMLTDIVMSFCDNPRNEIPVLVDCVDNNATRVFIHETIQKVHKKFPGVFSLSSGNEFLNGQVVCGCTPGFSYYNSTNYEDYQLFRTPTVTEMFPEILEGGDKLPTELSCDEAAVSYPQNIMTNITAANLLFNFANILLNGRATNDELKGLTYYAVTFNTEKGIYRTFLNKEDDIKQYLN